jgi:hypothetical protein
MTDGAKPQSGPGVQAQRPASSAAPAAAPAKGGSKTPLIIGAVVVIIIILVLAIVFLLPRGSEDSLSGQWTVTGGEFKTIGTMNNDTSTRVWMNETIPASSDIVDFDNPEPMSAGIEFVDLGGGDFEIHGYSMGSANFGTITGHYEINGDTMTMSYSATSTSIDEYSGDYMEIQLDVTTTFARA